MTSANDIEAQAMEWLIRLDALDAAGPADAAAASEAGRVRAEFAAWCDADPRGHAAFIRLRSAWRKADQLRRLSALDGTVDIDLLAPASPAPAHTPGRTAVGRTQNQTSSRRPRSALGWRMSLAAGVALVAAGALVWSVVDRLSVESYSTGVGGFERLLLADGSTVELDTDSEIQVRLTNHQRRIALVRGQANFKVATDAHRPFEVDVAETTVRALGTAFSVRLRNDKHVQVLVTEGRVKVLESSASPAPSGGGSEGAEPILSAGEAVIIKAQLRGVQPLKVPAPDMARQLSWTQGRLTFDGETLAEAVEEFNRYNPRVLAIADPTISAIRVGGSFQPTDLPSFIAALERSFGVKVQSADAREIRLARAQE